MVDIGSLIDGFFKYKYVIMIIILCILFIIIAFYIYFSVIRPKLNPTYVENNEFANPDSEKAHDDATLYFFYTTWCPYCKQSKPEWDRFKERMKDVEINNTSIVFEEIDCDKNAAFADKYKVTGYPTIKLVKSDGTIYDYDAKPSSDTLYTFLQEVL